MDRFDPFVKYADVYGDIINWEKDPMNKPQNQNKYFFSDGKTYYEQICKMLRLMSVFKEAFNQIYSNEDEISEAWENFVNNLSASVVEGSEPDVTLTWTDDSVNFEFTMVPGVPGEQGVGITSISFNSDYTMTITLSDGNTYTSMSLKGETGQQGPQGETGSGLQILDVYATLADLQSAHPTGQPGDAYQVGSAGNYTLYIWSSSQSAWVSAGSLGTVSPSVSNPLMDGTASTGSSNLYSRGDHVHPSDTSRASKEELDALIKTSQYLIDQSFTYRKSPAIQDGLARFDKIKGNTLVWNQLFPLQTINYTGTGYTLTSANDGKFVLTVTETASQDSRVNHSSFVLPVANRGHKLLLLGSTDKIDIAYKAYGASGYQVYQSSSTDDYTNITFIFTNLPVGAYTIYPQIFDLTQMGLDITDPSEFTSLFSLPYYSYNQSSLLSFNSNGIKTVGKNLLDPSSKTTYDGKNGMRWYELQGFRLKANKTYTFSASNTNGASVTVYIIDHATRTALASGSLVTTYTPTQNVNVYLQAYRGSGIPSETEFQLEFGSTPSDYEPYTSSTLSFSLPTLRSSGKTNYDELTHEEGNTYKHTVKVGMVTYDGSSDEYWTTQNDLFFLVPFPSDYGGKQLVTNSAVSSANVICNKGNIQGHESLDNGAYGYGVGYGFRAYINNEIEAVSSNLSAFRTWLSNNPLTFYYPLATPTETAVDLDMSFNSYENGTEQLLPVNGSVPSTSPIIADMTYLSIDDAMEYVLEKLANVPQNTQQILESLEDDVADLQTDVGALQTSVSGLQTSVGNINTNIGQLSSTVAGHTSSISDMQSDITDLNTGLSDLEDTVTDNTSRIGTLETDLASTDGQVQNLGSSVSTLSSTVSDQGTELGEIDSIIQDISNNPVISALGSHELGFVMAHVDATLPANTGTRVTIPKPVIFPNNYTPLFIVGMSTGSYDVSICEIPHTFGNSDSVKCRVWNNGSQKTTQITVYILCMRQRQSQ